MHYLAYVVIPPDGDPNELVDKALAPFSEDVSETGWWDWYQIGGRWTAHFDDRYDPQTDPVNQEVCDLCRGTGQRDWSNCNNITPEWIAQCNGCNGCHGKGTRVKWQLAPFDGDVVPVTVALANVLKGDGPFTLVAGEAVLQREQWIWDEKLDKGAFIQPDDFDSGVVRLLTDADPTWRVVAVDYHC